MERGIWGIARGHPTPPCRKSASISAFVGENPKKIDYQRESIVMAFSVMGFAAKQQEQNVGRSSESQQTNEPPLMVIYTTDDEQEAQQIVNQGGFINPADDVWYVAREYLPEGPSSVGFSSVGGVPSKSSLMTAEEDGLTNNSAATIDSTGRVRTDPSMHPATEDDVHEMVEADLAAHDRIPKKSQILED